MNTMTNVYKIGLINPIHHRWLPLARFRCSIKPLNTSSPEKINAMTTAIIPFVISLILLSPSPNLGYHHSKERWFSCLLIKLVVTENLMAFVVS